MEGPMTHAQTTFDFVAEYFVLCTKAGHVRAVTEPPVTEVEAAALAQQIADARREAVWVLRTDAAHAFSGWPQGVEPATIVRPRILTAG